MKAKVREVLRQYEDARDCDIKLAVYFWTKYCPGLLMQDEKGIYYGITFKNLREAPGMNSIARVRAVIQNVDHEFLPTCWDVAKKRNINRNRWEQALGYSKNLTLPF